MIPAKWIYLVVVFVVPAMSNPIPNDGALVLATGRDVPELHPDTSPSGQVGVPGQPKIEYMHILSDIEFRFARTLITAKILNPAHRSQEVSFEVVLPENAFITGFVMDIDRVSYRAYVQEKEAAKNTYRKAVVQGKAAAHVSYRSSNLFNVSVNIQPGKIVIFNLTYEELLQRHAKDSKYHHVVTISPGQVVPDMKVHVHIIEPLPLKDIGHTMKLDANVCSRSSTTSCSPTDRSNRPRWTSNLSNLSDKEFEIIFAPKVKEQKRISNQGGLQGQFEVTYDVERAEPGGEILVRDGYFIHFFAPPEGQRMSAHVVFVLDISGSMLGRKIQQLWDAMATILRSLRPDDYFNIITFNHNVKSLALDPNNIHDEWPFEASLANINRAIDRLNTINIGGATNAYAALRLAVQLGNRYYDGEGGRKPVIMFLTDGEPNYGEYTKHKDIEREISSQNSDPKIPIYSVAFGEEGGIDFLTRLSLQNRGVARLLYEGPDASVQLKHLYRDISNALLRNVTFKYLPSQVDIQSVTQLNFDTFFQGTELVVAGRTASKNTQQVLAEITADSKTSGKKYTTTSLAEIEEPEVNLLDSDTITQNSTRATSTLERAWAYLTIKQLIDRSKDTTSSQLGSSNPAQRALDLALQYSFVTELTSLVVVKPDATDEVTELKRIVPNIPEIDHSPVRQGPLAHIPRSSERKWVPSARASDAFLPMIKAGRTLGLETSHILFAKSPPPLAHGRMTSKDGMITATFSRDFNYEEDLLLQSWRKEARRVLINNITADLPEPIRHDLRDSGILDDPEVSVEQIGDFIQTMVFDKVPISSLGWLYSSDVQVSGRYSMVYPNGTVKNYRVLLREPFDNPLVDRTCRAGPFKGQCRHFAECPMRITKDLATYRDTYQCAMDNYLAICCIE